jgi:aspartate kinase
MKVLKFGGTSIGSPERIKALLPLVDDGTTKIVVLSALAGTTNQLETLNDHLTQARRADAALLVEEMRKEYHKITVELFKDTEILKKADEMIDSHFDFLKSFTLKDFSRNMSKIILAQGELISTALFYLYAVNNRAKASLLPALSFMRIDKDGEPDMFYIKENLGRILPGHSSSEIIITQGFICRNAYGDIDNLKRGGSDYTATLIGAAVKAEEVQIWTDINGVHNNDPRYVKNTRVIRKISFDEAAEMAYFGAKILHPSSVLPVRALDIPVRLKNSMSPSDDGTLIGSNITEPGYRAVAAKDNITVIKVKSDRMLMAYGFLRKIFEIFEIYRTPIDMITTSEVAVSITIDDTTNLSSIAAELKKLGSVEVESKQSIICIVGDFIAEKSGSTLDIFNALKGIPIRMISYGGSRHNVSVVVSTTNLEDALNSLNDKLFNGDENV